MVDGDSFAGFLEEGLAAVLKRGGVSRRPEDDGRRPGAGRAGERAQRQQAG